MNRTSWHVVVLGIGLAYARGATGADGPAGKILVEFFPSAGATACGPAADLARELARAGIKPERLVVLDWHPDGAGPIRVDADPLARRRADPNLPGRADSTGSVTLVAGRPLPTIPADRAAAIARLRDTRAGIKLDLKLSGTGPRRSLAVRVGGPPADREARDWLVGVALAEDHEPASAAGPPHPVVRHFTQRSLRLVGGAAQIWTVPVDLIEAPASSRFRLTVFVQQPTDGGVVQAESIPCPSLPEPKRLARRHRSHPHAEETSSFVPWSVTLQALLADPPSCDDCGETYTPGFLITLPPVRFPGNKFDISAIKLPSC